MKLLRLLPLLALVFALLISPFANTQAFFCQGCENEGESEGGGSGSGDGSPQEEGGAHELFVEDFALEVSKVVSFDGENFFSPEDTQRPAAIPEEQTTTVFVYVTVHNPEDYSAVDVEIQHGFTQGMSDMVLGSVLLLEGPIDFNANEGIFHIAKIAAGHSVSFLYQATINELGQNDNTGLDELVITNYETALQIYHDGLNYVSLGAIFPSYFLAIPPAEVDNYNIAMGHVDDPNGDGVGGPDLLAADNLPPSLVSVGMDNLNLIVALLFSLFASSLVFWIKNHLLFVSRDI